MRESKIPNSYLNRRSAVPDIQDNCTKVQTEVLVPATVKISGDLASFANPYSILTNEFVETKAKSTTVHFVLDPVELSKHEVKLPKVNSETRVENSETIDNTVPNTPEKVEKTYPLPEVPAMDEAPKSPQMSDMEILNRLSQYQETSVQKPEMNFDVPKDAEIFNTPKVENNSRDLEILNELQADETDSKQVTTQEQINTEMNGLEGLLAELSDEGGSSTLGMG